MSVLFAQQVACEKSDRQLFSDINIELHPGQLLYVTGENGAGKTSLLRILVGLSSPSAGHIEINGHDVQKELPSASESLLYFGHKQGISQLLTATENLRFWCQQHGVEADQTSIHLILAELGLTGLEDIALKNLSAGQQRRVSLAKLWLKSDAKLWVLDEPFTALDVHLISELENKMASFLASGGAIIMTSHQALNIDYPMTNLHLEYSW
ncbi:MAG: heme exporter protein A [Glaciecola sp.]